MIQIPVKLLGKLRRRRNAFNRLALRCESLTNDLIHIVITVGSEPPDKNCIGFGIGQCFITLVKLLILIARDRVIGIAISRRIFGRDARLRANITREMLVFGDPAMRRCLVWIIHGGNWLKLLLIEHFMFKAERTVRQSAVTITEIFIDRPSINQPAVRISLTRAVTDLSS